VKVFFDATVWCGAILRPAGMNARLLDLASLGGPLRGVTDASATTIWRWLHDAAIKPWQVRSWLFPRDPDFARKAAGGARPLRLIHLPVHASWLNQIELYFSIVQRKALTPNDFGSLEELSERLLAFQARYAEIARPFEWTFTRPDLERVPARIADHEPALRLAA